MKFATFFAVFPAVLAAELAYKPPTALKMKAQSEEGCNLPADYDVRGMSLRSNDTGKSFTSYEFTFSDKATKIETLCQWNRTSVSTTPPGLTPRFGCANHLVQFIYTPARHQFTMVESVCPGSDERPSYEAAGTFNIYFQCRRASGSCETNQTDYHGLFTSLEPSPISTKPTK